MNAKQQLQKMKATNKPGKHTWGPRASSWGRDMLSQEVLPAQARDLGMRLRSPVFRTVGLSVLAPKQRSPGEPLAHSSGDQKDQGVMRDHGLFPSLLPLPPATHPRAGP